jgi:integrase
MSLKKRGQVWWYKFQFNGQPIQKSAQTSNKEVARQIEAAHRVRLAKGEVGIGERPAAPVFKEFAPRFTKAIETLCANKPQTVTFYKRKLGALLKYEPIASTPLDGIDEAAIQAFKQSRSRHVSTHKKFLSPASVNRELSTLRRLLRLAQEWKVIDRVPRIRLLPGEQGREFVLNYEQEKLYLGSAPPLLHDMAVLMLDTGLRVGEAIHLEWPDVHLEPAAGAELGYLKVRARHSKNSKPRNVPLTARVVEMLRSLGPHQAGYVFHRGQGQPVYQTWLNQQHSDLRALLKLPAEMVPHSFRHTYGTRLGEAGADAFTIKQLMGHSSITVSQKYVHPTPETVERAVQRLEKLNQGKAVKKLGESAKVGTKMGTAKEAKIRKC